MFIKICGITNAQDALLAVALGADALGFVLAPSPRRVSTDVVKTIISQLPNEVMTFGVFVEERPEHVVEIVHSVGLSGAQLHGNVGKEAVDHIAERVRYSVRAFVAGHESSRELKDSKVWAVLLDSPSPGSGEVFDWSLVDAVPERSRLILAGGLNHLNVGGAIREVRPFGVDVSTGVEESHGKKDPTKLRMFISAARSAGDQLVSRIESGADVNFNPDEMPYNWEVNS